MSKRLTKKEYELTLQDLVDAKTDLILAHQKYHRIYARLIERSPFFPKEVTQ